MLKPERFDKIVRAVEEKGTVTVDELCDILKVSKATVRRDLLELDREKMLARTHGGATLLSKAITEEVPIAVRTHICKEEKERIAEAAVSLISEGETIYVGAGTTAAALARRLGVFSGLTVVTNDIQVATIVAGTKNSLIVSGGALKASSYTLLGIFTESVLAELHVDTTFMAVDAVDLENGFMDFGVDEVSVKRMLLNNSKKRVMLCDSSKFNISAFIGISQLSSADIVITNTDLDEAIVGRMEDEGVRVITV